MITRTSKCKIGTDILFYGNCCGQQESRSRSREDGREILGGNCGGDHTSCRMKVRLRLLLACEMDQGEIYRSGLQIYTSPRNIGPLYFQLIPFRFSIDITLKCDAYMSSVLRTCPHRLTIAADCSHTADNICNSVFQIICGYAKVSGPVQARPDFVHNDGDAWLVCVFTVVNHLNRTWDQIERQRWSRALHSALKIEAYPQATHKLNTPLRHEFQHKIRQGN